MFSKADLNSGLFQGLQVQVVVHKHEIKGVSFSFNLWGNTFNVS